MAPHKVTLSIWPETPIEVEEQELVDLTRMGLIISEATVSDSTPKPAASVAKGTEQESE